MNPRNLFAEVSSGKFKPVYYFYGPEAYRRIEAEKYIARQFLPDRQLTTNYQRIDGKRCKSADLMAQLSVYPMIGERQVISVSDFQRYKPTEIDRLLKLLAGADPNRVVVLSSPESKTPKKTSAFFKKVTALAQAIEFRKLSPTETRDIISHKLNKAGLTAQPEALTLLADLIAGNRGALEVELAKLIDYKGADKEVTLEDVHSLGAGFQVFSIFDLADEITDGSALGALTQVKQLLTEGNSPTGILFFVGKHFVSLYLVKSGKPLEPYRRFLAGKFQAQARRYEAGRLEDIIIWCAEADAAMRHGKIKPKLLLEQLIIRIVQAKK